MEKIKLKNIHIPSDEFTMVTLVRVKPDKKKATLYINGEVMGYVKNYRKSLIWFLSNYSFPQFISIPIDAILDSISFNGWTDGNKTMRTKAWSKQLTYPDEIEILYNEEKKYLSSEKNDEYDLASYIIK